MTAPTRDRRRAELLLTAPDGSTMTVTGLPPVVAALTHLWEPFLAREPAGAPTEAEAVRVDDVATGSADINREMVARTPHPAVHAGVVAIRGGAIAYPAVSGAGKSTLTAALCASGAGYVSDEALVLDDTGPRGLPRAVPYPKPLALSPWSAAAVGLAQAGAIAGEPLPDATHELLFAPARLGPPAGAVTVAHLLLPFRDPEGATLETVPRREGLAALLELSFNHFRDPRRFLRVAAETVRGAQVHRLGVGDPLRTAAFVLDRLG